MSYPEKERLLENGCTADDNMSTAETASCPDEETKLLSEVSTPVTLTWDKVTVKPPPPKKSFFKRKPQCMAEPKPILSRSTGIVQPGSLMAVIGASGSGKSVLLNVLTQRNLGDLEVAGDIRVNGQLIGNRISKICAYVQQTEAFIGTLKVREHLWFQAQLRLDKTLTDEQRHRRVNDVMAELGLSKRAETLIGIPGKMKTLSGGERRRLLFASEILTNPLVLFCDEPTTGLDAFMAQSVISLLRDMAANGMTILCTIHQPASEVYAMFDQLTLLANGRTAFMGSTKEVLPFFSSVGFPCPANYNPADFFIHTLACIPGQEERHREVVSKICDAYERSVYYEDIVQGIKDTQENIHEYSSHGDFLTTLRRGDADYAFGSSNGYQRSCVTQLRLLCWRNWLQQFRDPVAIKSSVFQFVIVGLFEGLIYLNQQYNQKGVMNIDGALFMMQMMITFNTLFAVLSVLPGEYNVFKKEYQDRMYRVDVYYISHILIELPVYVIALPFLYLGIVYWMIGFYPGLWQFVQAALVVFCISLYALGISHLIATVTCSVSLSLAMLPLIRNILTIFGGYFINVESIPWPLYPLEYLSAFAYSNEIMVVNQWQNVEYIYCEYSTPNSTDNSRCLTDGQQVISSLSFSQGNVAKDYTVLLAIWIGAELLGLFALYRKAQKFRR